MAPAAVHGLPELFGSTLALFESPYWLQRLEQDHPDLVLERLVAEGSVG